MVLNWWSSSEEAVWWEEGRAVHRRWAEEEVPEDGEGHAEADAMIVTIAIILAIVALLLYIAGKRGL